jgi:hypothetical protein
MRHRKWLGGPSLNEPNGNGFVRAMAAAAAGATSTCKPFSRRRTLLKSLILKEYDLELT